GVASGGLGRRFSVEAALLFGLIDRPERMQSRPIPRVRPLRPAPEAALAQIRFFIIPKLMMEVDRASAAFVNHQHQFVIVTGFRLTALDLTRHLLPRPP